jgi:hypothetical protein
MIDLSKLKYFFDFVCLMLVVSAVFGFLFGRLERKLLERDSNCLAGHVFFLLSYFYQGAIIIMTLLCVSQIYGILFLEILLDSLQVFRSDGLLGKAYYGHSLSLIILPFISIISVLVCFKNTKIFKQLANLNVHFFTYKLITFLISVILATIFINITVRGYIYIIS